MHDPAPSPARTAPRALWRVAEAFLRTLHALFGGPERIAHQHTLTAPAHRVLAAWLRCAEAMLRRLLVIEAAAYAKPNTRPLLAPQRKRVRKLMGFDADHPEAWRVSFHALHLPPQRGGSAERREAKGDVARAPSDAFGVSSPARGGDAREDRWSYENFKRVTFRSAWPLAERFEACLRVFNDPAPYARRLSRRLHATPHRLAEALRAPPEALHRVDRFPQFGRTATRRWRAYFSSA